MINDFSTNNIISVLGPDGKPVGSGFVLTMDGHMVTCAHVVQDAQGGPSSTVTIAFRSTGEQRQATVERWRAPDQEDVAILKLKGAFPAVVECVILGPSGGTSGHRFKTFGFPEIKGLEGGMSGYGKIGDYTTENGHRVLQLTGTTEITQGFSGGPLFDEITRRVVGMVGSILPPDRYGRGHATAFVIPTETIRAVCPEADVSNMCPYQGLDAFTEDVSEFFFGQEQTIKALLGRLRNSPRFLLLVGASGSGKTSVVQAGVLPRLKNGEGPGGTAYHIVSFRPGDDPYAASRKAFFAAQITDGLVQDSHQDDSTGDSLQNRAREFSQNNAAGKRLLLFIDQFEELFALCTQAVQQHFMDELLALLQSDLPILIILAVRADFYNPLLQAQKPWAEEALAVGHVPMPLLDNDDLRVAIEKPAVHVGLRFQDGLVERIVEDASRVKFQLPLLEHALQRLWEHRQDGVLTHQAYETIGYVAGAISQWAEDLYSSLPSKAQTLTRQILTRLIHYGPDPKNDTRRGQPIEKFLHDGQDSQMAREVIDRLIQARLLVAYDHPSGKTYIEIIHDALLSVWGRLERWREDDRKFQIWRQTLQSNISAWQEKQGSLLVAESLKQAKIYLAERPTDLDTEEKQYIEASLAQQKKQNRMRILLGGAIGLVVIGLLAFSNRLSSQVTDVQVQAATAAARSVIEEATRVAAQATTAAEADRRATAQALQATAEAQTTTEAGRRQLAAAQAQARQLANQSNEVRDRDVKLSVLSAIESVNVTRALDGSYVPESEVAVYRALTSLRSIAGHATPISRAGFVGNGTRILTLSDGGIAGLWDLEANWLTDLESRIRPIQTLAANKLGTRIVVVDQDGIPRLMDGNGDWLKDLVGHSGKVQWVSFDDEGGLLATTAEKDKVVRLWNSADGSLASQIVDTQAGIKSARLLPDGKRILTLNEVGTVRLWTASGQVLTTLTGPVAFTDIDFSPAANQILTVHCVLREDQTCSDTHVIQQWSSEGRFIRELEDRYLYGVSISFSPDGNRFIVGNRARAGLWNIQGQLLKDYVSPRLTFLPSFSPDGTLVVGAINDNQVGIWDSDGHLIRELTGHTDGVTSAEFSPDGTQIVTASDDGTSRVYTVDGGLVDTIAVPADDVTYAQFSADGKYVLAHGSNGQLRIWGTPAFFAFKLSGDYPGMAVQSAFSLDSKLFATTGCEELQGDDYCTRNGISVRIWDLQDGSFRVLTGTGQQILGITFSPDSQHLAIADPSGITIRSIDGTSSVTLKGFPYLTHSPRYNQNGTRIATAGDVARLWDDKGNLIGSLDDQRDVASVLYSPNGDYLVTTSYTGPVVLRDDSGSRIGQLGDYAGQNVRIKFGANGQRLLVMDDKSIRLWDAVGHPLADFTPTNLSAGQLFDGAISPDGHQVVTIAGEKVARLWDAGGQPLNTLEGHTNRVTDVQFSTNGQRIATVSLDGTIRVWDRHGNSLVTLTFPRGEPSLTHTDVEISPDGRFVVAYPFVYEVYPDIDTMLFDARQRVLPLLIDSECTKYFDASTCANKP
jgi:WD40 repeat protein